MEPITSIRQAAISMGLKGLQETFVAYGLKPQACGVILECPDVEQAQAVAKTIGDKILKAEANANKPGHLHVHLMDSKVCVIHTPPSSL